MPWRDHRDLFRQMEFDLHRFTEEAMRGFLDGPGGAARFWQPATDVHTTDVGIVLKLELAGATTENLSVAVSADGRQITVSGVRIEPEGEREARTGCQQLEIYFGPFERTFVLPGDFTLDRDAIKATLKNGFLTITLPRRENRERAARTIPIETIESDEG